jgi:uncharacterized protein YbbK (DUF523 family)
MMDKLKIAVSSCLLGHNVRYNKTNKRLPLLRTLEELEYIPICPEITAGFGVPRESIQLEKENHQIRLIRRVDRQDVTDLFCQKNELLIRGLVTSKVCGVILKSKSPSCGVKNSKLLHSSDLVDGLFTMLLRKKHPSLPLISEVDLQNLTLREEFLEACTLFNRVYRDRQ